MKTKKWYSSKTIWFNIIMTSLITLEASLGSLSSLIPTNIYGILAVLLAVGNSILRVISTVGVTK